MTPEQAQIELYRRKSARNSLLRFANAIDIPGKPVTENDQDILCAPIETTLAAHHLLLLKHLEMIAKGEIKRLMVFMCPGSAKALALDTPIPTPSGWTTMGALKVGDQVFDENGLPCNVTWRSPIWKDRPCYNVTTDCGDVIVADRDHEWLVSLSRSRRLPVGTQATGRGRISGKTGRPPLDNRDDPASRFKIKETWELARTRCKRPMIQRAKALSTSEADLPLDPYLLGVWLGDGSSDSFRITSSVEDQIWLRAEIERIGYETRSTSVATLFQVIGGRDKLVTLGVLNDTYHGVTGRKHIPETYLRASYAQRLALLQGLIDTDGTISKSQGCATFCNTNLELALQVRELVRSLGVKAGWSETRATLNGVDHGPAYRVSFYHEGAARLPRKAQLCRNQTRTPNTYIDVVETENHDTVCIEVDSPSHLFLCGRSMTPTHNSTYTSIVFPSWFLGWRPDSKIILASYGTDLARRQAKKARSIVVDPKYKSIFNTTLSGESGAADDWALTNKSEFMACGLLAGVTGRRAHGIIIDDPVAGREEADSETNRRKTRAAYEDDLRTRLLPGGWEIIVQTRWHSDDLSGGILPANWKGESGPILCRDGQVWHVICLPAIADRADDPLGRKIGERMWPEWFTEDHFDKFRGQSRTWAALFQQRPVLDEGAMFREEWFHTSARPMGGRVRRVRAWDFGATADGDYTVGVLMARSREGQYCIEDVVRFQGTPHEVEKKVLQTAREDNKYGKVAIRIPQDPGQAGVSQAQSFIRMLQGFAVKAVRPTGPKTTRAEPFAAQVEAGNVSIYQDLGKNWKGDFIAEHCGFPLGSHDDQVDAASLAFEALQSAQSARIMDW